MNKQTYWIAWGIEQQWSDNPQIQVEFKSWNDLMEHIKLVYKHLKVLNIPTYRMRVSESAGFDNQGYYFNQSFS